MEMVETEINREAVQDYVEEFRGCITKVLEDYIEAGNVIVAAKVHLNHGEVEAFYKECNLSPSQAKRFCYIAESKSLNRPAMDEMEINGYTVQIPETINIDFGDLASVKTLENKINKNEATGIDLEDLLSGKRTYKEITTRQTSIAKESKKAFEPVTLEANIVPPAPVVADLNIMDHVDAIAKYIQQAIDRSGGTAKALCELSPLKDNGKHTLTTTDVSKALNLNDMIEIIEKISK